MGDQKYAMNCLCNLGIMEGGREFEEFASNFIFSGMNNTMSNYQEGNNSQTLGGNLSQSQLNVVYRKGNNDQR